MEVVCIKSKFMKGLMDQNTYVVKKGNSAIIIDAGAEVEDVLEVVKDVKVSAILMTHLHFDHFWNIEKYLDVFACKVYVCDGAQNKFADFCKNGAVLVRQNVVRKVENEKIAFYEKNLHFENIDVDVYFTPGHCADCVCLRIDNILFSGDMLFE